MAASRTRLRRRHIVPLVLAVAVLPLGGLAWASWQLLAQDRAFQRQQQQERLDESANQIAATLRNAVSGSEQALAKGEQWWPAGAVAVTLRSDGMTLAPPDRIAFLPVPEALPSNPDARTAALLARGRELAGAGQHDDALLVFSELRERPAFAIEGAPSWLAARYWRLRIFKDTGSATNLREESAHLARDLNALAPYLSVGLYQLYAEDLEQLGYTPLPSEPVTLSLALDALWRRWSGNGFAADASGREVVDTNSGQTVAVWQTSHGALRALIVTEGFVESVWMPRAHQIARERGVSIAVRKGGMPTSGLPWALSVSNASDTVDATFRRRRTVVIASFLTLVVVVGAASYVAIRSIDRELAVAKHQSDFVAAVSHEFRTPLTSLKHFVELLREQPTLDQSRRRDCYDAQARSVDRLSRLVETLLDFGRLDTDTHQYRFAPRDCAALAESVVSDFNDHAQNAGYRVEIAARYSATINVDAEAVSRALWNLLDNAMKYSPEQKTIEVGVRPAHGSVCIDVRDRGIGVGPQESRDIFRRFHRGAEARSRGIRGTGLGLAMVVEIMQAHGGRVDLDSQRGQGSTFTLVFPEAA